MLSDLIDFYVAGSVARWQGIHRPGQVMVDQPGLHGILDSDTDPQARLLVSDDRAYTPLLALRERVRSGFITVLDRATRCFALLADDAAWTSSTATAMVCRDLTVAPQLTLPDELDLRPVRRVDGDPVEWVALQDAVSAVVLAAPGENASTLVAYLRSMSGKTRLFAAVDAEGVVRATSGWQLSGTHVRVIFVDTDPAWRRRGIATAMTSLALQAARRDRADRATLDASESGRSIYLRLGFESVAMTTRFEPAQPSS